MNRRTILKSTLLLWGAQAFGALAAPNFPNRPTRLVVGFPPGGGTDVVARLLGARLSIQVGQQMVIENRPGATGTIAAAEVARANSDGYTLFVSAVSTNVIAPLLYTKLNYDDKSFTPITLLASVPHIISVHPFLPIKSIQELVSYAKANPHALKFGSAGTGSTVHIAGEWFKARTGTQLDHVPYKGAGQSIPDLLAGRLNVSFDTTGTILPHINNGSLRPLAIAAPQRFPTLPDLPTTAQAGLDDFELSTWIGLFAPPKTADQLVDFWHSQCAAVLTQPEVRSQLAIQVGSDSTVTASPHEFAELQASDAKKFSAIIKDSGIKI